MTDYTATWLNARFVELDSTHMPGVLVDEDGTANEAAAILIGANGKVAIIEGRPADLVVLAERILQRARDIEVATMVSPDLLSLYGGTEPSDVPELPLVLEEQARERLDAQHFEPPVREYDLQDPDEREI
jgi:hypothetical protein